MSTTISTVAMVNSNIALIQAQEAKKTACEGFVTVFDSKTASVELMQKYADCVNLLYPNEMPDSTEQMLKIAFVICLAAMVAGLGKAWKERKYGDFSDWFLFPAFFGVAAAITLFCGYLLVSGLFWLFS